MDLDALVMRYLAAQGLFLSPYFSIDGEWENRSHPDFVALDFGAREIQVVKVSTAYNIGDLVERIENREAHWFSKVVPVLVDRGIPVAGWTPIMRAFICQDRHDFMLSRIGRCPDVRVEVLEDVDFPCRRSLNTVT